MVPRCLICDASTYCRQTVHACKKTGASSTGREHVRRYRGDLKIYVSSGIELSTVMTPERALTTVDLP
jgi:hypothetical protein